MHLLRAVAMDSPTDVLHNTLVHDDLIFLHCARYRHCLARVDKQFTYHTLQFMARGGVRVFYDDEEHALEGAWAWPADPRPRVRLHALHADKPWDHRYVAFTGPRVAQWQAQGLLLPRPQQMTSDEARPMAQIFDDMISQTHRPDRWGPLRAGNLLEQLLLRLAERRSETAAPGTPWLTDVLEKLADLDSDADYDNLASAHGLAATTLRRHFRTATGTSPHAYRVACRIAEARRRLGETNDPIKHIADQLGYRDVYYFTRQFTQQVGVSPGQYRRSRQR